MKWLYTQGGGNDAYSAPSLDTLEVSAENGFADSVDGTFGEPGGSVPDNSGTWW